MIRVSLALNARTLSHSLTHTQTSSLAQRAPVPQSIDSHSQVHGPLYWVVVCYIKIKCSAHSFRWYIYTINIVTLTLNFRCAAAQETDHRAIVFSDQTYLTQLKRHSHTHTHTKRHDLSYSPFSTTVNLWLGLSLNPVERRSAHALPVPNDCNTLASSVTRGASD